MRVVFTRNHHVPINERSRRMYKRGHEYEVSDEIGKAVIDAKRAKAVSESRRPADLRIQRHNVR